MKLEYISCMILAAISGMSCESSFADRTGQDALLRAMKKTYFNSSDEERDAKVESVIQGWNSNHENDGLAVTNKEYWECKDIFNEEVQGITKAMAPLLTKMFMAYERTQDPQGVANVMQEWYSENKVSKEEIERCRSIFSDTLPNVVLPDIMY